MIYTVLVEEGMSKEEVLLIHRIQYLELQLADGLYWDLDRKQKEWENLKQDLVRMRGYYENW